MRGQMKLVYIQVRSEASLPLRDNSKRADFHPRKTIFEY
jgi:hypothetical protein